MVTAPRQATAKLSLALLALGAYAWTLALGFQFDDYWLLLAAREQLTRAVTPWVDHGPLPALLEHLFQPVLWLWLEVDAWLAGSPLRAWPYHATSVLVHATTSVALFSLLRRHLEARAAFVASAFFAVAAAGAQAVSWTAARGDMVFVTFSVLALLAVRRRPWLAGCALALGFASKPNAWLVTPLVLAYACLPVRRDSGANEHIRACTRSAVAILVPLGLVALWRRAYLGTWSMLYLGGIEPKPGQAKAMLAALPGLVGYTIAPGDAVPRELAGLFAQRAIPLAIGVATWSALLLLFFWRRPRVALGRATLALLVLAIPLAPALFLWHLYPNAPGIYKSRALYPLVGALALVVALAFDRRFAARATRVRRSLEAVVLIGLMVTALDSMLQTGRLEVDAAMRTRSRVASIEDRARAVGRDVCFVVSDPEPTRFGVLMTHTQIGTACRPPFMAETYSVRPTEDVASWIEAGGLTTIEGRVQVLRLEDARFVPASAVLPQPTTGMPSPAQLDRGDQGFVWRPDLALHPRSTSRIVVEAELGGPATEVEMILRCGERSYRRRARLEGRRAQLALATDRELALEPRVDEVVIKVDNEGLRTLRIAAVHRSALLTWNMPAPGAVLTVATAPIFTVDGFPMSADLVLELELGVFGAKLPLRYVVPHADVARQGQSVSYQPQRRHFTRDDGLEWSAALRKIYEDIAKPYGVHSFGLEGRVLATENGVEVAASERRRWTIDARD